jgi:hypothetical protein
MASPRWGREIVIGSDSGIVGGVALVVLVALAWLTLVLDLKPMSKVEGPEGGTSGPSLANLPSRTWTSVQRKDLKRVSFASNYRMIRPT